MPAFTAQPQSITALWLLLISRPAEGRRLSWPRWDDDDDDNECSQHGPPHKNLTIGSLTDGLFGATNWYQKIKYARPAAPAICGMCAAVVFSLLRFLSQTARC